MEEIKEFLLLEMATAGSLKSYHIAFRALQNLRKLEQENIMYNPQAAQRAPQSGFGIVPPGPAPQYIPPQMPPMQHPLGETYSSYPGAEERMPWEGE